jgi:hypothetical protein
MTTQTKILIGALCVLIVAVIALVLHSIILKGQLEEQTLKNGAFKVKIEQLEKEKDRLTEIDLELEKEVAARNAIIDSLINELNNLPTDEQVKETTDITLLDANASWQSIKEPIDAVIEDTAKWSN